MLTRWHNTSTYLREGEALSVNSVLSSLKQVFHLCLDRLHTHFVRWTRPLNASLLLGTIAEFGRSKSELMAENALLRQQLITLKRQVKQPVCAKGIGCSSSSWPGWSGHGNKRSSSFNQKHCCVGIARAAASLEAEGKRAGSRRHRVLVVFGSAFLLVNFRRM